MVKNVHRKFYSPARSSPASFIPAGPLYAERLTFSDENHARRKASWITPETLPPLMGMRLPP